MKIEMNEAAYAEVSPELRTRFFSFIKAAELRAVSCGPHTRQYLAFGPGDGRPLLFFTGGIKHPLFSFSVIEAFGRRCRVVAPVQPPCPTLAEFFTGVDAMLERERMDAFFVAGSSWGGQLAQAAGLRYAGRAQKMVLASTGLVSGKLISFLLRLHRRSAARMKPEALMKNFRARITKLLADSPEAAVFWRAALDDLFERFMSRDDYISLIDTQIDFLDNYAAAVRERGFDKPVLILSSKNESAGSPKMRERLRAAYPHADFFQFSAGGHHPALLHLAEYRKAVEDFLFESG